MTPPAPTHKDNLNAAAQEFATQHGLNISLILRIGSHIVGDIVNLGVGGEVTEDIHALGKTYEITVREKRDL